MTSDRVSQHAFFGVSALLFVISAALTIAWCVSMSGMGMPMPGDWTMSMTWMRMPSQTGPGAAASFLGMWLAMMVAMMLPSLVPTLWRYHRAVDRTATTRLGLAPWPAARMHCSYSSSGLTAILLVIGVMDLRAMAAVTAAITVERLAPAGERVARVIGMVIVGTGLVLLARAIGP